MQKKIKIENKIIKYNGKSVSMMGFGTFSFPKLKFNELGIPQEARAIQLEKVTFKMVWNYEAVSLYDIYYTEFDFPFELSESDLVSLNLLLDKKNNGAFEFSGERWEVISWSGGDKFKANFSFAGKTYTFQKIGIVGGTSLLSQTLLDLTLTVNMDITYRI